MKICPSCKRSFPDEKKFCNYCGELLLADNESPRQARTQTHSEVPPGVSCPSCGKWLSNPNANFCRLCGAALREGPEGAEQMIPGSPYDAKTETPASAPMFRTSPTGSREIVWITSFLAALLMIGGIVVMVYKGSTPDSPPVAQVQEPTEPVAKEMGAVSESKNVEGEKSSLSEQAEADSSPKAHMVGQGLIPAEQPAEASSERVSESQGQGLIPAEISKSTVLAEGTTIEIRLAEALSSARNISGDSFEALVDTDLTVEGQVIIPRGSRMFGRLHDVVKANPQQEASMLLVLTHLRLDGKFYSVETDRLDLVGQELAPPATEPKKTSKSAKIGRFLGAILVGERGRPEESGAAAQTPKTTEVEFQVDHKLTFRLNRELTIEVP